MNQAAWVEQEGDRKGTVEVVATRPVIQVAPDGTERILLRAKLDCANGSAHGLLKGACVFRRAGRGLNDDATELGNVVFWEGPPDSMDRSVDSFLIELVVEPGLYYCVRKSAILRTCALSLSLSIPSAVAEDGSGMLALETLSDQGASVIERFSVTSVINHIQN